MRLITASARIGPALPIFRTETQARVLGLLYLHPERDWTLATLARELGSGPSTLHREVHRLEEAGLLTATIIGRSRVLRAQLDHPVAAALTEILRYLFGPLNIVADEFGQVANAERLLIFGSWAARHQGEPGPPPHDIDVLVVGPVDRSEVYAAADRAQERIGMPVNPVVASRKRWSNSADALIREIKARPVVDLTSNLSSHGGRLGQVPRVGTLRL